MAFTRPPVTPADGTFSVAGAAAWAAGFGVAGATVGGIPYFPTATTETTSSDLTFNAGILGAPVFSPTAGYPYGVQYDANTLVYGSGGSVTWYLYSGNAGRVDVNGFLVGSAGVYGWSASDAAQARDTGLSRLSAGVVGLGTGTAGSFAGSLKLTNTQNVGYVEIDEMTAPAGAANSVRLFTQDLAGKTQLMAIFGSGVAQQIAIEI